MTKELNDESAVDERDEADATEQEADRTDDWRMGENCELRMTWV